MYKDAIYEWNSGTNISNWGLRVSPLVFFKNNVINLNLMNILIINGYNLFTKML